jgi:uncharacterized membrane protein YfcA
MSLMWQDNINGIYEFLGGFFILLHCIRLRKHKKVRGVSIVSVTFFASWGVWNLYYYPSLGQWCSFAGGLGIVLANALWIGLMIHYIRKERKAKRDESLIS